MKKKPIPAQSSKSNRSLSEQPQGFRSALLNCERLKLICFVLLIAVATIVTFGRLFRADFVLWDDDIHVYKNPHLNPMTGANVLYFWQHPYVGMYIPLSYTLFALLAIAARLPAPSLLLTDSGALLNPHVFHAANVGLHVLNVLLVFAIVRMLVRSDLPALAGALLFGLHPLQVESVAWLSELRGLSSGFFSLLSIWLYLRYASARRDGPVSQSLKGQYVAAFGFGILALLCKPSAVILPLILFALDHWCLGRSWRKSARSAAPWLVLGIPFTLLQTAVQPVKPELITPFWTRPLIAGDALAFYFSKFLAPINLVIDYGHKPRVVLGHWWGYLTWMIPTGLAFFIWRRRRSEPWLSAAAVLSVAVLLPVLGPVPFSFQYFSTVADRYLYLALLGPALALAFVLNEARGKAVTVACGLILLCFASLSVLQTRYWDNTLALLGHSLETTWNSDVVQCNYGIALARHGDLDQAMVHFNESLRINPENYMAHMNIGNILLLRGKPAAAIAEYRTAIKINPSYAASHSNLGDALAVQGDLQGAIGEFHEALRLDPNSDSTKAALQKAVTLSKHGSNQ